jgi:hypothetical protein
MVEARELRCWKSGAINKWTIEFGIFFIKIVLFLSFSKKTKHLQRQLIWLIILTEYFEYSNMKG